MKKGVNVKGNPKKSKTAPPKITLIFGLFSSSLIRPFISFLISRGAMVQVNAICSLIPFATTDS